MNNRVKPKTALLIITLAILSSIIVCGNSSGPKDDTISQPALSPLTDSKPHFLNDILSAISSPVISMKKGDVNNDNAEDIILSTLNNEVFSIINQQDGTYVAKNLVTPPLSSNLTTNYKLPTLTQNPSKTDFDSTPPVKEPQLTCFDTGDINKDGYNDLVLAYAGIDTDTGAVPIKVLSGNSTGNYTNITASALPFLDIPIPVRIKLVDVNADSYPDIIITSPGKTKVDPYGIKTVDLRKNYVLTNSGTNKFTDNTIELFGEDFANIPAIDVQTSDFDQNGQNDLLLLNPQGNILYVRNSAGIFEGVSYNKPVIPSFVEDKTIVTDIDNNGKKDVLKIDQGKVAIIYNPPDDMFQKPLAHNNDTLSSAFFSPFQYTVTGPNGKDYAAITQIGQVVYFELDSILPDYVYGNIRMNFDPARLRCVSIEEDPNNWYGFWTWWTPATGMPEFGGGGTYYNYDDTGKGSDWAQTWVSWYGPGHAGPVGTYDNTTGTIRLYTSTPAGYSYTSPLRIGFEVLQTGPTGFSVQSNDFTAYDWQNLDAGWQSSVEIVQLDQCVTNEDAGKNVRVKICGPAQAEPGERYIIAAWGQLIAPQWSPGWNIYAYEFYENGTLIDGNGFNWGETKSASYDFTKTQPGTYTYLFRMGDRNGAHGYTWVEASLTVVIGSPVTIFADEFVPIDTAGATAELYADVQPPSLLDGAVYYWRVASGSGGVFTETSSQASEFIPNGIGVTTVEFVLQTTEGTEYIANTDITAWDFRIVSPGQTVSKPVTANNSDAKLFQADQEASTTIVVAKGEIKTQEIVIDNLSGDVLYDFDFEVAPGDGNIANVSIDLTIRPPKITIEGKNGGHITINVSATDPAPHHDTKTKKLEIYIVGTTGQGNGQQSQIVIVPDKAIIAKDEQLTFTAWGIKDGKAAQIDVKWEATSMNGSKGEVTLVNNVQKSKTIVVAGMSPGMVTLKANGQGDAATSIPITIYAINLDIYDSQTSKPALQETTAGNQGKIVPEEDEEVIGAFAVVNLNDTNNNGTLDIDDNPIDKEQDLIRLTIKKPEPVHPEYFTVRIETISGADKIKIWENENKSGNPISFPKVYSVDSSLDKTFWIEGIAKNNDLNEVEFEVTYGKAIDKACATFVWAQLDTFRNSGDGPFPDADESYREYFTKKGGDTCGLLETSGNKISNKMEMRLAVFPDEIYAPNTSQKIKNKVKFDVTRQKEGISWDLFEKKLFTDLIGKFPENETPQKHNEIPNDDQHQDDEDNVPQDGFLYVVDAPNAIFNGDAISVKVLNFHEFVRLSINQGQPSGNSFQGSRCSERIAWHCWISASKENGRINNEPFISDLILEPDGALGPLAVEITDAEQVYTSKWRVAQTANANVWTVKVEKLSKSEPEWVDYPNALRGVPYAANGISFTIQASDYNSFWFSTNGAKRNAIETGAITIPNAP